MTLHAEKHQTEAVNKTERLASIYLLFLSRPEGVSFQSIRTLMPLAYEARDDESNRRKFERDKKDLEELGMELVHYGPGTVLPSGEFARDHVYIPADRPKPMPSVKLSEKEASYIASMLLAEIEAADTGEKAVLKSAYSKLFYDMEVPEFAEKRPAEYLTDTRNQSPDDLKTIHRAISRKALLRFRYGSDNNERIVYGRGLISYRGRWAVVAEQKEDNEVRTFYLDRMNSIQTDTKLPFRPGKNFKLSDYSLHPLAVKIHQEETVRCRLRDDRITAFRAFLSGFPENRVRCDTNTFELKLTNRDSLFNWILRHPGSVTGLGPSKTLKEFETYLESVRSLYAG